jgi:hypothetical protein
MAEFYPRLAYISDVTNAVQATITFTEDHTFTVGEILSFRVTKDFGMVELNNLRGKVLSLTDDMVTVDVNTLTWTPFDYSSLDEPGTTPPTCVPSSSGVIPGSPLPQTNIYDSFDHRP